MVVIAGGFGGDDMCIYVCKIGGDLRFEMVVADTTVVSDG